MKNDYISLNLCSISTGLTKGTIYISTEIPGHISRIKFYRDISNKNKLSTAITISHTPKIIIDSLQIETKEKEEVFKFIKINHSILLQIWEVGATLYKDKWNKLINKLKKI